MIETESFVEVHFAACWTIVFLNKFHENSTPTVWVCVNERVYDRKLKELQALKHIEIVQNGPSHVAE